MTKPNIHPDLQKLAVPIDSLNPYYKNPRRGDVPLIEESLEVNGQYRPIMTNVGTHTGRPNEIAGGNHTWQAAFNKGWTEIATTWIDVTEEELARIVAADNRSNDQAWYDEQELADLLQTISVSDSGLLGTGFTADDLDDLIMKLQPPDMEALEQEFGTPDESDTWPTIRLNVPRPLFNRWQTTLNSYEGEPHEQLASLLDDASP